MPDLTAHQSASTIKALFIGDSGSGKTGALASLAKDYELFIQDFDNGLDILMDPKILDPALRPRVHFHTLTDKVKDDGSGNLVPAVMPSAYTRSLKLLNDWKDGDKSYGSIESWGPDRVLVIDSATFQGKAILRYVLEINGKSGKRPSLPLWGDAIDRQEDIFEKLYSEQIKCHVIVTAHVSKIDMDPNKDPDKETFDFKGYPSVLGSKLPTRVGRYFNNMFMAVTRGTGANAARVIRTRSEGITELKISAPSKVPSDVPLSSGLSTIFKALLSN